MRPTKPTSLFLFGVLAGFMPAACAMSVSLTPSLRSPAPLGAEITWRAKVAPEVAAAATLTYTFRARAANGIFHTVVDFGPKSSLKWTTIQGEGNYEMEVAVKDNATGEVASSTAGFTFTSLVTSEAPVVTQSANPLVFIYSAPACAAGSRMRVAFQTSGGVEQNTPWRGCTPGHSMNFYLAGMLASTSYTAFHTIDSGSEVVVSQRVALRTPAISIVGPAITRLTPGSITPEVDPVLLQSIIGGNAVATDLAGRVLWYAPADLSFITRPERGSFLGIYESQTVGPDRQYFREFDLAGITLAETNAARVSEQLAALGMHGINSFHHEARKIDGGYLVLASSERILTDVQGAGPVDVVGDTILVLNENLQVVWVWDSFEHLDTKRMAVLKETCEPGNAGCPPVYLATVANDWLHGNSLQLTPDGNILYSSRHQDWLMKINYSDGAGDGSVLWRLGNEGDFRMVSSDPDPWFSHQHDANFEANGRTLTLFDDSNVRNNKDARAHSRGQAMTLNEAKRTAHLILNADVGSYSSAVGSAQKLSNGNYHFNSGFIADSQFNLSSQSVELSPEGTMVYGVGFASLEYRSFRMRDLYATP